MKKVMLLSSLVLSLCILTACSQNKITQPSSISSSSKIEVGQSKVKESKPKETAYDEKLAKDCVEKFMTAYYNFESANDRVKSSKVYCTSEVQKNLGLKESEKNIEMSSEITSLDIYQSSTAKTQYMALVETTINDNKVMPQLLKIIVAQKGTTYLVSDVSFPLMN